MRQGHIKIFTKSKVYRVNHEMQETNKVSAHMVNRISQLMVRGLMRHIVDQSRI